MGIKNHKGITVVLKRKTILSGGWLFKWHATYEIEGHRFVAHGNTEDEAFQNAKYGIDATFQMSEIIQRGEANDDAENNQR